MTGLANAVGQRIKAVIFDYGGVLTTRPLASLRTLEQEMGYAERELTNRIFHAGGPPEDDWELLEKGRLPLPEFHSRVVSRLGSDLGLTPADYGAISARFLKDAGIVGIHWMMVRRAWELRADGYVAAILTNQIEDWREFWRSSVPLEYFDLVVDSVEVGLRKPEAAIYELTCDRLGVVPSEALFLDDSRRNIEGARRVGLHAILVRDPVDAIDELDAFLAGSGI